MDDEIQGDFLDISKTFDKVWYESLIFKLKQSGIPGNLLNILVDLLRNRKQRVVLNCQPSDCKIFMKMFVKVLFWDHCYS